MASTTRVVTAVPGTVFDFDTERKGTVSFFSNDLNISFSCIGQAPGILLRFHTGPIMILTSFAVGIGTRITLTAQSIGNAFPVPPLSLVQLQTDTLAQSPGAE